VSSRAGTISSNNELYLNNVHIVQPLAGDYAAYDVNAPIPTSVKFTNQGDTPDNCWETRRTYGSPYGLISYQCSNTTHHWTKDILSFEVENGKFYYVQFGAGFIGIKLMKDVNGMKDITKLKKISPQTSVIPIVQ